MRVRVCAIRSTVGRSDHLPWSSPSCSSLTATPTLPRRYPTVARERVYKGCMSNRVNVFAVASRAALIFNLPLVASKGSIYPDNPRFRCQGATDDKGNFYWRRESDGKSVACLSLDISGIPTRYRLDFHRKGESGVFAQPLGSYSYTARELSEALYTAESAIAFLGKKYRP